MLGCLGNLVLCQVPATTVTGQATTRDKLSVCLGRSYIPVRPDGDHPRPHGDRTATRKCTRSPANVNTTREKVSKNYKLKQNCVLTAFLLRPVRSYHVLTACPPRPLHAYGVSYEIYGLGNGDHGRSRGALTTIMGFLPRVFYVYRECTATSGRFYHVLTATIY